MEQGFLYLLTPNGNPLAPHPPPRMIEKMMKARFTDYDPTAGRARVLETMKE